MVHWVAWGRPPLKRVVAQIHYVKMGCVFMLAIAYPCARASGCCWFAFFLTVFGMDVRCCLFLVWRMFCAFVAYMGGIICLCVWVFWGLSGKR